MGSNLGVQKGADAIVLTLEIWAYNPGSEGEMERAIAYDEGELSREISEYSWQYVARSDRQESEAQGQSRVTVDIWFHQSGAHRMQIEGKRGFFESIRSTR